MDVCNVSEAEAATGNGFTEKVIAYAKSRGDSAVIISAAIEAEVVNVVAGRWWKCRKCWTWRQAEAKGSCARTLPSGTLIILC